MKIVRIAVFDLVLADCNYMAQAIKTCFDNKRILSEIVGYTNDQAFIMGFDADRKAGIPYDIVFVGIDNVKGVETAWNIRRQDEKVPLIVFSTIGEYGVESFRFAASNYLIKPVSSEQIQEALNRIAMN